MKINISFPIIEGENCSKFIDHPRLSGIAYGNGSAIKELREKASEQIEAALTHVANQSQRKVIGCESGEVLIVRYHWGWGYDICGPDRHGASSCGMNGDYHTALEAARKHAASGYGGIKWEC